MNTFWQIVSLLATAVITHGVTWFFSRKKQHVEVQSSELDNVQDLVKLWRETAFDLRNEIKELKQQIVILEDEVRKVLDENASLTIQLNKLKT